MTEAPRDDYSSWVNENMDGWSRAMGIRFVVAKADEVVCEVTLGPEHLQGYGVVHGGVHAGILETLASVGAAIHAFSRGQSVVGLENHTSFVRAVRGGLLRGRAVPVTRGRRSQLWEGSVTDEQGRVVATGRVRLLCLDPGAELGGEPVAIET